MHKRNIALIALALSAIITAIIAWSDTVNHSAFISWSYLPVFLASAIISGGHPTEQYEVFIPLAAYTILYWVVFVIVYALLLELYLLRQVLHHIDEARNDLAKGETHPAIYLRRVGNAMTELERRRRSHWVLQKLDDLDLTQDPQTLAANAIVKAGGTRQVKRLLRHLEGHIAASKGSEAASSMMLEITRHAHTLAGHKEQESSRS